MTRFFIAIVAGLFIHVSLNTAASTITPAHSSFLYTHGTTTQSRNFAFARCVALSFDDAEIVRADANIASSTYAASVQLNDADVNNMDGFVRQWLKKPYLSMQGGDLRLMRCIDFQQIADIEMLPAVNPVRTYGEATQLFNYALASCVGKAFGNKVVRDDASLAAAAYIEFGNNGWDDYRHIGELVREWFKAAGLKSSVKPSQLEKCMDIYHGPELRGAVAFYSDKVVALLRSFALHRCVALHADNPAVREEEHAAADEIVAVFGMRADVSDSLSDLAEQWLKRHPKTNLACDDFHESPELMEAVKRYTGFSQVQVLGSLLYL